jgi:hypothetical protein
MLQSKLRFNDSHKRNFAQPAAVVGCGVDVFPFSTLRVMTVPWRFRSKLMAIPCRRLRLSLRMLLLFILVAALWLGWRVDKARRQHHAIAQVENYNGYVRFDYEFADGREIPDAQPRVPKWLRRHLGDDYFRQVSRVIYVDQPLSDATLAPLTDLSAIEELRFLTRMWHVKAPVDPPPGLERLTEAGLSRLGRSTSATEICGTCGI